MINIVDYINAVKDGGGLVWDTLGFLNLIGIRDLSNVNKFNDKLIWFWHESDGSIEVRETLKGFTTDPGLKNLKAPVNSKGCAILAPGWHRKIWVKGKHKGQYSALVQYADCKVFRDNTKDGEFDFNPAKLDVGKFGINLHRANAKMTSIQVDGWSAGCQVVADPREFASLMERVDAANKAGQAYFSYFLMNKQDWMNF